MSTRTLLCSVLIASCLTPSLGHAADWATVASGPGNQVPDRSANDGSGGVYFSWIDVVGGAGASSLRLQRITDDGAVAAGWPVNGRIPTVTDVRRAYSSLVPDGSGGVFIGWQQLGPVSGTTYDVYLQRLTGAGQIASGWPSEGLLVAPVNGKSSSLAMISDGTGGVFLTWFSKVNDVRRVYAQRIDATGAIAAGWPQSGVPISSASGTQLFNRACLDGQGGLLVAWTTGVAGSYDIYAQHLLADGTRAPGWPETGIAVCTAPDEQVGYQLGQWMVSDGAGGFVCTWMDRRSGDLDIYAQRMTGSGSIASGWPVDGVQLNSAAGDQVEPVMETDDAGGAFVAWTDNSHNSDPQVTDQQDLYAHHVLSNGTLASGWPAGGYVLSDADYSQYDPKIARDGAGGAYFVWEESYAVTHATRLGPSGIAYPGWVADGNPLSGSTPSNPVLHPSGDLIVGYFNGDHLAARVAGDGTNSGQPVGVVPGATVSSDLGVAPHPVGNNATLSFALRGGQPATLELFAIDGRRVWQREVGSLGAGRHTVPYAASATLPAGVYRLRLTEGTTSMTRSLVHVR